MAMLINPQQSAPQKKRPARKLVDQIKRALNELPNKLVGTEILPKVLDISMATKEGRSDFSKIVSGSRTITLPTGGTSKSAMNKQKKTARDLTTGVAKVVDPQNPTRMFNMMRDSLVSKSCTCQNCPMQPTVSEPMEAPEINPPRTEPEPLLTPRPPRPLIVLPTQRTNQTFPPVGPVPQNELESSDDDADNIPIPMDTETESPITESELLMAPQPSQPQTDLPMQAHAASVPLVSLELLNELLGDDFNKESGNESGSESDNDHEHSPKKLSGRESIHDVNLRHK
jgi:hypothetical protein